MCVVGGGFTGLWTAYHLLERDPSLDVLVVEADTVGFGASGRNGGWCSGLFPVSTSSLVRRHGREAALDLRRAAVAAVQDLGDLAAAEGIDCDWALGGTVVVAHHEAAMERAREEVADAQHWGVDRVDLLDAGATAEHVQAQGAVGGTFTPDCARVHPGKLVHGLAAATERRGVRVVERTRALRIGPGLVTTSSGEVRCRQVVRATEAYTPMLDGAPRRAVAPVYSLVLATRPLPAWAWERIGLASGETFSDHRFTVVYGQRTADDRLVFGGRGAPYHWRSSIAPEFDRDPRVHHTLATSLGELFPVLHDVAGGRERLADVPVDHTWGGPLGIPRDWHPSVGHDRELQMAWAGGYVGDGVALAQLAGATLADLLVGRRTDRTELAWVGHRSPRWEPEPLRWLGINAGLRTALAADAQERRRGRTTFGSVVNRLKGR